MNGAALRVSRRLQRGESWDVEPVLASCSRACLPASLCFRAAHCLLRTRRRRPRASPVTFAVIGDYGVDDGNEARRRQAGGVVGSRLHHHHRRRLLRPAGGTGTGKYDESTGAYYGSVAQGHRHHRQRAARSDSAAVNAFFPSLGNHDYSDATPAPETYLNYFTLPGAGFANTLRQRALLRLRAGPGPLLRAQLQRRGAGRHEQHLEAGAVAAGSSWPPRLPPGTSSTTTTRPTRPTAATAPRRTCNGRSRRGGPTR